MKKDRRLPSPALSWRIVVAFQFAAMGWLVGFGGIIPFAAIIFDGITFMFSRKVLLLKLIFEFLTSTSNQSLVLFLGTILPSRNVAPTVVLAVAFLGGVIGAVGGGFLYALMSARFLRRKIKRLAPDIFRILRESRPRKKD